MSNVELYRERAERAERLARGMTIQSQRDDLLKVALEWRALADSLERRTNPADRRRRD